MWKFHITGLLLAIAIVAIGLNFQPEKVLGAEEYHWGFKKSTNGVPTEAGAELDAMLERNGAIYKGQPDEKIIYLSFDNGYENGYTETILDTLKKENVPATFFLTGHYLESATDLVKRMIKDGHTIGNHSYGHPNMARLTPEEMKEEWQQFDDKLQALTGVKRTIYARPPEGTFNEQLLQVGNEAGYRHIFWSIAFKDWLKDQRNGKAYAYNELMNQLHPGAIILMHTVAQDNAEAIPDFIRDAKKQGYIFKSFDDLVMEYENIQLPLQ